MRLILLVAVALMVATGCQTSPRVSSHIDLLNSEKRILEDELYELEYEYDDALAEIDELRTENERLNRRLGTLPSARPSIEPRRTDSTKKSNGSDLDFAPPMIDEGMLTEPKIEVPDQKPNQRELPRSRPAPMAPGVPMTFVSPVESGSNASELDAIIPPESSRPRTSQVSPVPERLALDPTDPRITHLFLDPLLTGGSDFDRQPGDDGVVIALETRNHENRFVPLAGPISVVILDPTQEQQTARVARWDLEAQDVEQVIRAANTDPGIRLRLPWPNGAPQNNRLQLFVRYVTVDGRKLETSREIFVTLPGQFSQRWTPRSSGRPRVLASTENSTLNSKSNLEPSGPESPSALQPASHSAAVEATLDQSSASATATRSSPSQWQPQR